MNSIPHNNIQFHEEDGIDIKKYVFLILSHWWWFAVVIFISLTIAYLVNRYSQEVYMANCSIVIGEPDTRVGSVESILDELARAKGKKRKAVVENEITILKSYKLASEALRRLDFGITYLAIGRRNIAERQLYNTSPFIVYVNDSTNRSLPTGNFNVTIVSEKQFIFGSNDDLEKTINFNDPFKIDSLEMVIRLRYPERFRFESQASNKYSFRFNNLNSMANLFRNLLTVEVNSEKGSILLLSMTGYVPDQISDYLNMLCKVYVSNNLEYKNITSESTIKFIDEQLRGIVDSLEYTGLRLQEFRSKNKVINLSKEGSFLFEKMQNLQSEMAKLDIQDRYYKYLQDYIKEKKDFSDVVAPSIVGIGDQLLNSLVAELNRLNLQRRNLNLTMVDNSPQISILNNNIQNTREALYENLVSLRASNRIAITDIENRVSNIEVEVKKLPSTERQLMNIEREFTINDQIYTFLLEKRAEAGITKASNTSDHKILDVSRSENVVKIKPMALTNYLISLVVGGLFPLVLLILKQFFNNRIVDRKQLEAQLKTSIIGNIGHNSTNSELSVIESPRASISESFRAMRTNLQYILKEGDSKVVALTSGISGEGKTFTSTNLASIISMAGNKTLLVSLDLRRPKVHKIFNLSNDIGISTYLIGKSNFEEIIRPTNIDQLYVVSSGPIPPNPSELLSSDKMKHFIEKASSMFDYVILDTPPIGIVTDTLILSDLIESLLFVIRHNYSDRQVVQLVNELHGRKVFKNISVVMNDIKVSGYYGYSYRYDYGYGYNYSREYYSDSAIKSKKWYKRLFSI